MYTEHGGAIDESFVCGIQTCWEILVIRVRGNVRSNAVLNRTHLAIAKPIFNNGYDSLRGVAVPEFRHSPRFPPSLYHIRKR